jgi:hypothetical protein
VVCLTQLLHRFFKPKLSSYYAGQKKDGTVLEIFEIQCDRPANRDHFNPKHGIPAVTFTILCDPSGYIALVTKTYPGKTHDRKVFHEDEINKKLIEEYFEHMTKMHENGNSDQEFWRLSFGGDKGYYAIPVPEGWYLYITVSGNQHDTSENTKDWDFEIGALDSVQGFNIVDPNEHNLQRPDGKLAEFRSIVERTIGDVKKWRILSNMEYVSDYLNNDLDDVITILCALTNWNRDQ